MSAVVDQTWYRVLSRLSEMKSWTLSRIVRRRSLSIFKSANWFWAQPAQSNSSLSQWVKQWARPRQCLTMAVSVSRRPVWEALETKKAVAIIVSKISMTEALLNAPSTTCSKDNRRPQWALVPADKSSWTALLRRMATRYLAHLTSMTGKASLVNSKVTLRMLLTSRKGCYVRGRDEMEATQRTSRSALARICSTKAQSSPWTTNTWTSSWEIRSCHKLLDDPRPIEAQCLAPLKRTMPWLN